MLIGGNLNGKKLERANNGRKAISAD